MSPPSGMRDFLPEDYRVREWATSVIRGVYESYGFQGMATPAMERVAGFSEYGEESGKLVFRIDNGEEAPELALRYDLTVPLARIMASKGQQYLPFFKRYQIASVWRADRPQAGRFREFTQCDIDYVGTPAITAEATVITAVTTALRKLGLRGFRIRVGDRRVLEGLLALTGIPEEKYGDALTALDKFDRLGSQGVQNEMVDRGFSPAQAFAFMQLVVSNVPETWSTKLERLESMFLELPEALEGVRSLRSLLTMVPSSPCQLDLTLARGLGYYTGAIFEISAGGNVSIGGGGRYDGLVGRFQTLSIPAVGFSLGLDRVLLALEKEKPVEIPAKTPDVYVLYMGEESLVPAFRVYQRLVSEGVSVELYPQADKLGKQVTYAVTRNAKAAVIIGKREAEAGNVAVKVFAEKTQVVIPEGDMMAELSMIFGTRLRGE